MRVIWLQCHLICQSLLPVCFDRDKDYVIILPPNLLNGDSILKSWWSAILGGSWLDIEIVGWLYGLYF
jgi:hypothetical protein